MRLLRVVQRRTPHVARRSPHLRHDRRLVGLVCGEGATKPLLRLRFIATRTFGDAAVERDLRTLARP